MCTLCLPPVLTFRFMMGASGLRVRKFIGPTTKRTRFITCGSGDHVGHLTNRDTVDDSTQKRERVQAFVTGLVYWMYFQAVAYIIVSASLAGEEGDTHELKKAYVRCGLAIRESDW